MSVMLFVRCFVPMLPFLIVGIACMWKAEALQGSFIEGTKRYPRLFKFNPFAHPDVANDPLRVIEIRLGGVFIAAIGIAGAIGVFCNHR